MKSHFNNNCKKINEFNVKKLVVAMVIQSMSVGAFAGFTELEEVVVTANKRSQNINDVGMSISSVTASELKDKNLTSLEGLATAVPGLVFSPSTTSTPIFTLRGVGFNESSLGVYPSTSLYIDEAPMPFPVLASHTAFDLEQVEVLKGPQGTLFGQNSTAGAINFIANKPTETLVYGGDIGYARFNRVELNGYVSGPLSENLQARLAINTVSSDDWQKSISRDDTNGEEDYQAARLLFNYTPSETIRVQTNFSYWLDKSEPQAQQLAGVRPSVVANASEALLTTPLVPLDSRAADWSPANVTLPGPVEEFSGAVPESDRESYQGSFRVDAYLSDEITLTSLTSYVDYQQKLVADGDGTHLVTYDLENIEGDIDSFNTELRLSGDNGTSLTWIVGANYEKSDTFERQVLRYFDNSNYVTNGGINYSGVTLDQSIESYAVFANAEYHMSESWTVKAGARYTDTTIDARNCGYSTVAGAVPGLFNYLGGLIGTVPFEPIGAGDCYTLNYDNVPGQAFVDTLSEDNIAWRFGVDYQINDDSLGYINVSKGYKTGSYPALAAAGYAALQPVTQESNLSFEVGGKFRLADGRVQLNAAAFYYDYQDKQVRGKLLDPVFQVLDTLINVPKSEIKGLEFDVVYQLNDNWRLSANATYLDTEITEYTGANILGITDNFKGDRLPFSPELSYNLEAEYRLPLSNGGALIVAADVYGQADSDAAIAGNRLSYPDVAGNRSFQEHPFEMDAYDVVNLRMAYQAPGDQWKVQLWGKNVTDEYYWTSVIPSSDNLARLSGRPVSYGITFSYNFQ